MNHAVWDPDIEDNPYAYLKYPNKNNFIPIRDNNENLEIKNPILLKDISSAIKDGKIHLAFISYVIPGKFEGDLENTKYFSYERANPEIPIKITYQDPCRLGRHMGVYEAPRNVLKAIPGIQFNEMERNRENAICCGVSAWMNCNLYSKAVRMDRLLEAQDTAERLITNCPHCLIHFNCLKNEYAESDKKYSLEIIDFKEFHHIQG